ncbi:MAG: hypothetical protein ACJ74T_11260 [Pyrinomonadaceae bacterium]
MNDKNRRVSATATSIRGFFGGLEDGFPANSIAGQRIAALAGLGVRIDELASKQAQEKGAAKATTERKNTWGEEFKRRMKEMRSTAVSAETVQPGVSQNFNLPASRSDESWLETARAFIAAGTIFKPLFLGRAMPDDFLEGLAGAVENFESAVEDYNLHSRNASAATAMLEDACEQVLAIRRELDPIVRNTFRNDPEKLAQWESASHLERPAKRAASRKSNVPPSNPQT